MINDILHELGEHVAAKNPAYNKHFTGAIQLTEGEVVKFIDGEGEYQGLSDTNANYFYVRYAGDIRVTEVSTEDMIKACNEQSYTAQLRLVSWVNGGNSDKIAKAISFDLLSFKPEGLPYYDIEPINVSNIIMEPEKVYLQETKKSKPDGIHRLSLVAIDFTISYRPYLKESCVDRNFCTTEC